MIPQFFSGASGWAMCALLSLVFAGSSPARAQMKLDNSWTIVAGSDPLEQTAAADFKAILSAERGLKLRGPVAASQKIERRAIFIGTAQTNSHIALEAAKTPFHLDKTEGESYHNARRGANLFLSGQTPKGAMNAVFRFLEAAGESLDTLDQNGAPAFKLRVANHKMNQSPPPDWSENDQARYYARHYLNVVWGEKHGPSLSLEARQKYGLGVMLDAKFPPGGSEKLDAPGLQDAVYFQTEASKRRALDPFDVRGAALYVAYFRELLDKNPDARVIYAIFGDYSAIPDQKSVRVVDGAPYPHSRAEVMKEILRLLRQTARGTGKGDLLAAAWMWHAFIGEDAAERRFMEDIVADGYGLLYNEAGNNDNWLIKRDNFNRSALETAPDGKSRWGAGYLPLVSAGGACESVNPVIAMPLPHVAGHKIRRLYDAGARNLVIWWGGAEGWTYDANLETISQLIWNPREFSDAKTGSESLLQRLAARDFGPAALQITEFWNRFDEALVTDSPLYRRPSESEQGTPARTDGLHIYDWFQRMGIFTEPVFGAAFARDLTPATLSQNKSLGNRKFWGAQPYALANYEVVIAKLGSADALLQSVVARNDLTPTQRERARQTALWSGLYRRLLVSQWNYLRAIAAMQSEMPSEAMFEGAALAEANLEKTRAGAAKILDSPGLKAKLKPILQAEIQNDAAIIAQIPSFAPNFNISGTHETVVKGAGGGAAEIGLLERKMAPMRAYLTGQTTPITQIQQDDAMTRKVRSKLANFVRWVAENKVTGLIGEVGWPGNRPPAEQMQWNELGRKWFYDADQAGIWVSYWATGEAWGQGYPLSAYVASKSDGPLDTAKPQAAIIEAQSGPRKRGINSAGGEFEIERFDSAASFQFLKNRGITWIRLPFAWGRIQPVLGGPLDAGGVARLKNTVAAARAAGLTVAIDCHNYMRRRDPQTKIEHVTTAAQLADLWSKLAPLFAADSGVYFDIMNEPHDLPGGASEWEKTTQTVLNAIRATGARNLVFIPGYQWSGADLWPQRHPKAWIVDPANSFLYEAHNYWDSDGSGSYKNSYQFEVDFATKNGY